MLKPFGATAIRQLRCAGLVSMGVFNLAPAGAVDTTTVSPIQHVVVVYMENHSFDNVLGRWCKLTGRCAGIPAQVTLKGGIVVSPSQTPDIVPVVAHSVASQAAAIDGGAMDGWASLIGCDSASGYACVSYYTPHQIPNLTSLASAFAVSDRTFSMADSPSWGGHLYAATANLSGFLGDNPKSHSGVTPHPGWGCDSNKDSLWRDPRTGKLGQQPSCIPDPALPVPNGGAYRPTSVHYVPTIFDRLDAAALSWRIYGPTKHNGAYVWAICPTLAECLYTRQAQNLVLTDAVMADARAGSLPALSIVVPGGSYALAAQHNSLSMAAGDNWIGQLTTALETGPEWSSTAVFITYDDCGCFYDHVPPGVNSDGTPQGLRSPLVLVSPYVKAHFTDSTPATFASILAYIEHNFGLAPLSINDAGAYDFANAFNYRQVPLGSIPMTRSQISIPGTVQEDVT